MNGDEPCKEISKHGTTPDRQPNSLSALLVSTSTAKRLLDLGNTKFWALVTAGKIEMVDIGVGRRMVRFSSLQSLIRS